MILRYLKGTHNKGTIITPQGNLTLDASLSISLPTMIPLCYIIEEMVTQLYISKEIPNGKPTITSGFFEDNPAAFLLATIQQPTNQTRNYHAEYHWF
jgi:hypothetical protein